MRRRNFIKTITALTGLAFVPASLLEAFDKGVPFDRLKWFAENSKWVIENIKKNKVSYYKKSMIPSDRKGFQIFKTGYSFSLPYNHPIRNEKARKAETKRYHLLKYKQHLFDVALHTIFSNYAKYTIKDWEDNDCPIFNMTGFLEKYGRLPKEEDRIILEYIAFAEFYERVNFDILGHMYRTECKLV